MEQHAAVETDVNCAYRCESVGLTQCTGFLFDENTSICSLGEAESIPLPIQPENTGLKVAWNSAVSSTQSRSAWFCIDGKTHGSDTLDNICRANSVGGDFPWLAIDMVHTQAVSSITIVNRKDSNWRRMGNIEVRVGNTRPPSSGAYSSMLEINTLCIQYGGSATKDDLTLSCGGTPIVGRYLTVQRLDDGVQEGKGFSLLELLIDSAPYTIPSLNVLKLKTPTNSTTSMTSQCPFTHPFSHNEGSFCCSTYFETTLEKEGGSGDWGKKGMRGMLGYNSIKCSSSSVPCLKPPCLNYLLQRYGCFLKDVDMDGNGEDKP